VFEPLEEAGRAHGRGRQRPERRDVAVGEVVEGMRRQRVSRKSADHLATVHQGTAQTRMDVGQRVRIRHQHPIEGIRDVAVRRKADRPRMAQDDVQTRVAMTGISPDPGFLRQAVGGQRHQLIALEPHQASGVRRDGAAHRCQQPLVTVLRRQGGGQIASDVEDGLQTLVGLRGARRAVGSPRLPGGARAGIASDRLPPGGA